MRSDLYSLGCTFYKLLTGTAPFSGPEQNSVIARSKPTATSRRRRSGLCGPMCPAEVEQVLWRNCWPRSRPTVASGPSSWPRPSRRWPAEPTWRAWLAACASRASWMCRRPESRRGTPEGTPRDSHATTQSIARSETPRPLAASIGRLPTWVRLAAVVTLVIAALAIAASIVPNRPELVDLPPPPIRGINGELTYDLSKKPLKEHRYVGWVMSPLPKFNESNRMLELTPETHQLIELGHYDGSPGTFSFTMSQGRWHGHAGIYFGCRVEPMFHLKHGATELTKFQYFELSTLIGKRVRTGSNCCVTWRLLPSGRSPYLADDHEDLWGKVVEHFDTPRPKEITVEITFAKDAAGRTYCQRVTANDEVLARLTTELVNRHYGQKDLSGAVRTLRQQGR